MEPAGGVTKGAQVARNFTHSAAWQDRNYMTAAIYSMFPKKRFF